MQIIAHRGDSFHAPENTVAAIQMAWKCRADGVELDLHLTADARPVVIHDATTRRTTDKNWRVADSNLEDLQTLDAGRWKHEKWSGERIPTVEEALSNLPQGKSMILEIKCGAEILSPLADIPGLHAAKHSLALTGFDEPVMRRARLRFPNLNIYWNAQLRDLTPSGIRRGQSPALIKKKALDSGFDGVCLKYASRLLLEESIALYRQDGLAVLVWTVDSSVTAGKLVRSGADAIITNRPGWIRKHLA